MANVIETELEQKTAEYFYYLKEFFEATGTVVYNGARTSVHSRDGYTIVKHKGN